MAEQVDQLMLDMVTVGAAPAAMQVTEVTVEALVAPGLMVAQDQVVPVVVVVV
jgi:hypothetical protein